MAAVFPYRGGCAPVPTPMAPLPDYMSEEKLQEKGAYGLSPFRLAERGAPDYIPLLLCPCSPQVATAAGQALCGEEEIRLRGRAEGGHAP